MGALPLLSTVVDAEQQINLQGEIEWYFLSPLTFYAGSNVLLRIEGNAPPFTWGVIGVPETDHEFSAAYDSSFANMNEANRYMLDYTQTRTRWNVLRVNPDAYSNVIISVRDVLGNKITQLMTIQS